MKRQHILTASAVLFLAAWQLPGQAGRGQGARDNTPPVQSLDVATAKKLVAGAEAAAIAAKAKVGIAVVDANGDLVYFERMDGATARAVASSQGKAHAAVLFGLPTKAVLDSIAAGKPVSANVTAPPAGGSLQLTVNQGGLPIIKDGKTIGGIGVGGSESSQDEKFAQAGLDAVTGK